MVRMRDIAGKLGVSVSTVSLALNHKDQGRVNPAMAERIRATAIEMGYTPNLHAIGLKLNKSHAIALISYTSADDLFLPGLLLGAQTTATDAGYILMTIPVMDGPNAEQEAIRTALQRDVDGIIFAADYFRERQVPEVPQGVPFVFLDCVSSGKAPSVTEVIADEVQGAYDATKHLIAAGHSRIGYIGIDEEKYIARHLREEGYRKAMREHFGEDDAAFVINAKDPSPFAGEQIASDILGGSTQERPTALFCFSDRTAFGVTRAAQGLGLSIPKDLSIVGFDNVQYTSEFFEPRLTTVELPHPHMSAEAVRQLIQRIDNGQSEPSRIKVPCPLISRESVSNIAE